MRRSEVGEELGRIADKASIATALEVARERTQQELLDRLRAQQLLTHGIGARAEGAALPGKRDSIAVIDEAAELSPMIWEELEE